MSKSLLVFGGNGFLGKRICQQGIESGYKVISVSRSGTPPKPVSHHDVAWTKKVRWEKADISNPDTYRKHVQEVDTVVHSIGLLFENSSYKNTLDTELNICESLKGLTRKSSPNPMERAAPGDADGAAAGAASMGTYASVQRDSAIKLAEALLAAKASDPSSARPTFVYVSADQLPPGVPSGYISTKRDAEEYLLSQAPGLRSILLRPGIMFDELNTNPRLKRNIVKSVLSTAYDAKNLVFGDKIGPLNSLLRPPVSTQQVARDLFRKLEDASFAGVVPLEELVSGQRTYSRL